jgi:hypothetical protein
MYLCESESRATPNGKEIQESLEDRCYRLTRPPSFYVLLRCEHDGRRTVSQVHALGHWWLSDILPQILVL